MLAAVSCVSLAAQKDNRDILKSTNIKEIESFLKMAHPDDPRRSVLKPRLATLRNSPVQGSKFEKTAYIPSKSSSNAVPSGFGNGKDNEEAEEYRRLMSENSGAHKEKTVKLLNQLFDNDVANKDAILLVQNNLDCNMIIRIKGKESYNLAVPARGENSVVLKKGEYLLTGNACDGKYSSSKSIGKNMLVTLNNNSSPRNYSKTMAGASN